MKPVLQVFAFQMFWKHLPNMRTKALKKKQLTRETHAITSNIEFERKCYARR